MRGSGPLLLALVALTAAGGCRNTQELLEAQLRTLETDLYELKAELFRTESENEALHRELRDLRQGRLSLGNQAGFPAEITSQTYGVRQLVLGRGTGGYDDDRCPGDEGLQVVVEPRDGDGHPLKASGSLHVEALAITPEGLKLPLSAWDISPIQLRRTWRSGWFSTGYHVVLPWQNWPSTEKVRVIARLTLTDGRMFEAEKEVRVRPTPPAHRRALPAAVDATTPVPDEPELTLPPPRKLDSAPEPGKPAPPPGVQPTSIWYPKKLPPLHEAVELLKPVPMHGTVGLHAFP